MTKREIFQQEIEEINDTNTLLKNILLELKVLNDSIVSSRRESKKQIKRSKDQIERIGEMLPPEARAIYDNLIVNLKQE
jgi:peptidoglycan hydrolase CwlO-like protein